MSLSIVLEAGFVSYHPDTTIRGTIALSSAKSIAIGSVSIRFICLSRVILTTNFGDLTVSNTDYHSRDVLFRRSQTLYSGGRWTHKPGEYGWPFAFSIPEISDVKDENFRMHVLDQSETWRCDGSMYQIPGSMMYNCRGFNCSVEYILEAVISPPTEPGAGSGKALSTSRTLIVKNNNAPLRGQGVLTYTQFDRVIELDSRLTRLSRALSSSRKHGEPPKLKVSTLLPTAIERDACQSHSGMSLIVIANVSGQVPTLEESVTIRSLGFSLLQRTSVRAGRHCLDSSRTTYKRKTKCSLPLKVQSGQCAENANHSRGSMDLAKMTQLRIPNESVVLSFKTTNLAVDHTLDVEIGFEYAKKTYTFVRVNHPISIINMQLRDTSGASHEQGQEEQQQPEEETWMLPPDAEAASVQYEDAVSTLELPEYSPRGEAVAAVVDEELYPVFRMARASRGGRASSI
jgi:hypothetical protein